MAKRDSQTEPKPEWHLMPFDALEEVVKVLMSGKKNYGPNDWRQPPMFSEEEVYDSLQRHIKSRFFAREMSDKKSGLYHTAHIACNALFALYYDLYALWANGELSELAEIKEHHMGGVKEVVPMPDVEDFMGIDRRDNVTFDGISIDTLARLKNRIGVFKRMGATEEEA